MSRSKVGLHIANKCGGCSGIESMWNSLEGAKIPFTIYSVNDAGLITKNLGYNYATFIYRDVEASTINPSDYSLSYDDAAKKYWDKQLFELPMEIKSIRSEVWIEIMNEPGKDEDQANWVGAVSARMAEKAIKDGYRVMSAGWSPGTPEPEHWLTAGWEEYLTLCENKPNNVAVSIHEYSLSNNIHEGEPWLIGRVKFLFEACDELKISHPDVYITECGWTLNSMPSDDQAKKDIDYLARLYAGYPTVQCAMLWTLQEGDGNGNLPQRLNSLIPWLTGYTLNTVLPDVDPPPDPEPEPEPPDMTNYLKNPSFDDGWTQAGQSSQKPNEWEIDWFPYPSAINPYDPEEWNRYKEPEFVHKSKNELPPNEWDIFIWDKPWAFKIFAGDRAFWARLEQKVSFPIGTYVLKTPVWTDVYLWDSETGKDYDVDPRSAEIRVLVNGTPIKDWTQLISGKKSEVETIIQHAGGSITLDVDLRCNYAIGNNFFVDGWSLTQVDDGPPPPVETYKVVVVVAPQSATTAQMVDITEKHDANKRTITRSVSDAERLITNPQANDESYLYVHGIKYFTPAEQETIYKYNYQLDYLPGDKPPPPSNNPLDGLKLGHLFQYKYLLTDPFNAPRDYGNLKHEGADYDISGGSANNLADVLCVYDGVVDSSVDSTGKYGKYVRVKHARNGGNFLTWYCHLDARKVQTGQSIKAGSPVGEVGTTGNVTGEHVHFNLVNPGKGLSGYVIADVVDPEPYMASGRSSLPQYTVPGAVSMATYFFPVSGNFGDICTLQNNWGANNERQQLQRNGELSYVTKNSQWEQRKITTAGVYLQMDTSPGEGQYYTVQGQWLPSSWNPGSSFTRTETVSFYYKSNCQPVPGKPTYTSANIIRFEALHASWTSPGNLTFINVIELAWVINGSVEERYWYAPHLGLVQWKNKSGKHSWVIERIPLGQQGNNTRETIPCSSG